MPKMKNTEKQKFLEKIEFLEDAVKKHIEAKNILRSAIEKADVIAWVVDRDYQAAGEWYDRTRKLL